MTKYFYTLLLCPIIAFSQQKFFSYEYNNLYGITDAEGTNVIDAKYTSLDDKEIDSIAILNNYKEKKMIFNLFSGNKTEYDEFSPNEVYIENEYFSLIKNHQKQYLIGQNSGFVIDLKEFYFDFKNLGPYYIVAKYEYNAAVKTNESKKASPLLLPCKKCHHYYVFKNNKKLSVIKEIISDKEYAPIEIYKIEDGNMNENNIITVTETPHSDLKPWDHFLDENYDYLTLKNNGLFELYNKDWGLINKIKSDTEDISKAIKKAIAPTLKNKHSNFTIEDARYAPSPMDVSDNEPFLKVDNNNGLNYVSYSNNNEYVFLFKTTSKIELRGNMITLEDSQQNNIKAHIIESNPKLHLPLYYIETFKIDFNN